MRTKNSLKNISTSFLNNILLNVLRFISRTIFIKILGETYLGINGILSNILGILSFADLGISSAISYSLYKPLIDENQKKIQSLMGFYKKAYFIIAIVILIAGLSLLPFLNIFINSNDIIDGLHIYYLIFLINMVIGYLFSYKRTLITANQKEYKIVPFIMTFNFLITFFQIIVLCLLKNYTIYLLTQTILILIENIVINNYINKQYPYLKEKNIAKLTQEELQPIKKNVKALIFHKLGSYFVDSTDNIIISKFLGLSVVGIYSNYYLIINVFNTFINSALYSIVSSIGNVNAKEKPKKRFEIFKALNFINFCIFLIISVCLYNLFNFFVGKIWLGEQYLLNQQIVGAICIIFFVNGIMHFNDAIKSSSGLYDKDKLVPIIQSLINILTSVLLCKYIGLLGVFIGTFLSALFVMAIKPYIIYKYVFEKKPWSYYILFIKEFAFLFICIIISNYLIKLISISNIYITFITNGILSISVCVIMIIIFYHRTNEFCDIIQRIKRILKK